MLLTNNDSYAVLYNELINADKPVTLRDITNSAIHKYAISIDHASKYSLNKSLNGFYCDSDIDNYISPSTGIIACVDLLNHYHKLSDGLTNKGLAKAVNTLRLEKAAEHIELYTIPGSTILPDTVLNSQLKRGVLFNMPKFLNKHVQLLDNKKAIIKIIQKTLFRYLNKDQTAFDSYDYLIKLSAISALKSDSLVLISNGILTNPSLFELNKYHYDPCLDIVKPCSNHIAGAINFVQSAENHLQLADKTDIENVSMVLQNLNTMRVLYVTSELLKQIGASLTDLANPKQVKELLSLTRKI